MNNNTHIANAVTQYQARRQQAAKDLSNMQQLETLASTLQQSCGHMEPQQVANFHRAMVPDPFPYTRKPTQHGHWAHAYIDFMREPTYHGAHRCLEEIAGQTADNMGKHSPQEAALFTAALHITFNHLPDPAKASKSEQHNMVELAQAVSRTQHGDRMPQDSWTPIIKAATATAARELKSAGNPEENSPQDCEPEDRGAEHISGRHHRPERNRAVPGHDRMGRFQYQTGLLKALETAKTILGEALARNTLSNDDPTAIEINDAWNQNHETCQRESTLRCAFNAVPSDPLYALANPPQLTPRQAHEMALAAHQIILHHHDRDEVPNDRDEVPNWLERAATITPAATITITQQDQLCKRLHQLMREYDSWFGQAVNFDDYGKPGNKDFERLNREHARHMTHYAHIIAAAATISAVHLEEQRDAVLVAASGTINWQTRQELEMFQKHTSLSGQHRAQALSRLDTATAIIRAMPDRVLPQESRKLILENDGQTRAGIIHNIQDESPQPPQ